MKRLNWILAVSWIAALPLFAAMSDSTAMRQAQMLWGNTLAQIGTIRDTKATNWTKQVGVKTPGCAEKFTVLGEGFNTWDNAFANYNANPPAIAGPLKGTVNFLGTAYDNVAVVKYDLVIDGAPMNAVVNNVPQPTWDVSVGVNTSLLVNGLHTVCATASDQAGNVGRSYALLFNVNQSITQSPTQWRVNPVDLRPSVTVPRLTRLLQYGRI